VRKNTFRTVTRLVSLALAAAASLLMAADPASASSGGGCRESSANGWTVASCVSENGGWAWPDFYVNHVGENWLTAECQMQLIDQWGDPISSSWWDCFHEGHYGPDRVLIRKGVHYYNRVTVWVEDRQRIDLTVWSPQLTG
jgi:hypothetical protein